MKRLEILSRIEMLEIRAALLKSFKLNFHWILTNSQAEITAVSGDRYTRAFKILETQQMRAVSDKVAKDLNVIDGMLTEIAEESRQLRISLATQSR